VTDNNVDDREDVHCPITPPAWRMKLLIEVGHPHAEHPTVAAHEPCQQKPAQ